VVITAVTVLAGVGAGTAVAGTLTTLNGNAWTAFTTLDNHLDFYGEYQANGSTVQTVDATPSALSDPAVGAIPYFVGSTPVIAVQGPNHDLLFYEREIVASKLVWVKTVIGLDRSTYSAPDLAVINGNIWVVSYSAMGQIVFRTRPVSGGPWSAGIIPSSPVQVLASTSIRGPQIAAAGTFPGVTPVIVATRDQTQPKPDILSSYWLNPTTGAWVTSVIDQAIGLDQPSIALAPGNLVEVSYQKFPASTAGLYNASATASPTGMAKWQIREVAPQTSNGYTAQSVTSIAPDGNGLVITAACTDQALGIGPLFGECFFWFDPGVGHWQLATALSRFPTDPPEFDPGFAPTIRQNKNLTQIAVPDGEGEYILTVVNGAKTWGSQYIH
jgi:hypothetical protein